MDHYAPASLIAEHGVLEAFLSLPLNSIDPGIDEGWEDAMQRLLARGHQRRVGERGVDEHGHDEGVTFNSGI